MPPRRRKIVSHNSKSTLQRAGLDEEFDLEEHSELLEESNASFASRRKIETNALQAVDLFHLKELFHGSLSEEIISMVYEASAASFEDSVTALSEMVHSMNITDESVNHSMTLDEKDVDLWDLLTNDLKRMVLSSIPARDMAKVASTCWEFACFAKTNRLTLKTITVPKGLKPSGVLGMVAGHPQAASINLSRWSREKLSEGEFASLMTAISQGSRSCRRMEPVNNVLLRSWRHLTDNKVFTLCSTLQHLRSVDFTDCASLSDGALLGLSRYSRSILESENTAENGTETEQQGNSMHYDETREPFVPDYEAAMSRLKVSSEKPSMAATRQADEKATMARDIDLATSGRSFEMDDSALKHAASSSYSEPRGLENVTLAGCERISDDGVKALINGLASKASLQFLDVSRCPRITSAALNLPASTNLRVLKVGGCTKLNELIMQLPHSSPLEELHLTNCSSLMNFTLVSSSLLLLNLSSCPNLSNLSIRCSRISQLLVPHCSSLMQLTAEDTNLSGLVRLNVYGCRKLQTDPFIKALSTYSSLASLNINGCWGLTHLELAGNLKLESLDASGCKHLQNLYVHSPILHTLRASSCAALRDLRVDSLKLTVLEITNCGELQNAWLGSFEQGMEQGNAMRLDAAANAGSPSLQLAMAGCGRLTSRVVTQLKLLARARSERIA